jgi:hypothetical protein
VLSLVIPQKPLRIAMQQRAGGDHLGVEQRVLRKLAKEVPTVPISPIHHRRYTEPS